MSPRAAAPKGANPLQRLVAKTWWAEIWGFFERGGRSSGRTLGELGEMDLIRHRNFKTDSTMLPHVYSGGKIGS